MPQAPRLNGHHKSAVPLYMCVSALCYINSQSASFSGAFNLQASPTVLTLAESIQTTQPTADTPTFLTMLAEAIKNCSTKSIHRIRSTIHRLARASGRLPILYLQCKVNEEVDRDNLGLLCSLTMTRIKKSFLTITTFCPADFKEIWTKGTNIPAYAPKLRKQSRQSHYFGLEYL